MTNNPIVRAVAAEAYIVAVVLVIQTLAKHVPDSAPSSPFIIPIVMLSLFVLSAAVMVYLFCFEPIKLYLDGEREAGMNLFLKTVGSFAVLTVLAFVVLALSIR